MKKRFQVTKGYVDLTDTLPIESTIIHQLVYIRAVDIIGLLVDSGHPGC